jgi:hypothetical protein
MTTCARAAGAFVLVFFAGSPARASEGWPDKIGPIQIGSKDDAASMRISPTVQGMYMLDVQDVDDPDETTNESTVFLRRLRFVLSGHLATKDLTYRLHLSTLPGSLELLDLWLDYRFHTHARVRVGLLKIPFTRYRNNSFKGHSMVDWAVVTQYFGAERQLGLVLNNGYGENAFEYELGLMTGVASRTSHARGLAGVYAESFPNRSDLAGPSLPSHVHPEIVLHLAYNHGGFQHRPEADVDGGAPRFSLGASASWDARPTYTEDASLRIAPEAWFKAYGFHAHTTGYLGLAELGGRMSRTTLVMGGLVANVGYTVRSRVDVSLQYAMVDVLDALREDARERADAIIAAETDPAEQARLVDRYESAGALQRRQEVCLGITLFLIGQSLKWTTELAYLVTTSAGADSHDMRLRSQLQLDF